MIKLEALALLKLVEHCQAAKETATGQLVGMIQDGEGTICIANCYQNLSSSCNFESKQAKAVVIA